MINLNVFFTITDKNKLFSYKMHYNFIKSRFSKKEIWKYNTVYLCQLSVLMKEHIESYSDVCVIKKKK